MASRIRAMVEAKKYIRYKPMLLILILNIFLFYFNANSYAESTLIVGLKGDSDNLVALAQTKYLTDKPVLIFSEQIGKRKIELLDKIDNIVFYNSTFKDLAVEFAIQSTVYNVQQSRVKIENDGIYELWLDSSGLDTIEKEELMKWEIRINGKEILQATTQNSKAIGQKYINMGGIVLKAGEHKIGFKNEKIKGEDIKILLVNKKEREDAQAIIWQKINNPHTGICYILEKEKGEFFINQ